MDATAAAVDLDGLAEYLARHSALRAKAKIELVSEVLGGGSWLHGPGDDGAVLRMPSQTGGRAAEAPAGRQVVACGEALLPAFVESDPFGAGLAAVLANVNDLAAMGATPVAIVDTIVASEQAAREVLRGLQAGSQMYAVPLVGGHLTVHDGPPALSAFGVGEASAVLSSTHVRAGQQLIVAGCTQGSMRADFPFFRSFDERGDQLAGDVRTLPALAASGAVVAAKDVSMAGLVGSLAMLLEWSQLGATVDLDVLPRPYGVSLGDWLTCFPALVFLLCAPPDRAVEALEVLHARGLQAAPVAQIDDSGLLRVTSGGHSATVLDLRDTPVTGLRR